MARRGKRERARVKKRRRGHSWCSAWGAGSAIVKLGKKKLGAQLRAALVGEVKNRTSQPGS
jgi:hypothetical protein